MKTTTSWIRATFPSTFARVAFAGEFTTFVSVVSFDGSELWILLCFTILVIVLLIPSLTLYHLLSLVQRLRKNRK